MGKQTKARKSESSSKGIVNVTPIQVAFIVDRYLSDNNYAETRSVFRVEASSLIAKSPIQEVGTCFGYLEIWVSFFSPPLVRVFVPPLILLICRLRRAC